MVVNAACSPTWSVSPWTTPAGGRQVYVVGPLPVAFLKTSNRNAVKTLSKGALRVRDAPGLTPMMTVAEFTDLANIEVIDLTGLLPGLR